MNAPSFLVGSSKEQSKKSAAAPGFGAVENGHTTGGEQQSLRTGTRRPLLLKSNKGIYAKAPAMGGGRGFDHHFADHTKRKVLDAFKKTAVKTQEKNASGRRPQVSSFGDENDNDRIPDKDRDSVSPVKKKGGANVVSSEGVQIADGGERGDNMASTNNTYHSEDVGNKGPAKNPRFIDSPLPDFPLRDNNNSAHRSEEEGVGGFSQHLTTIPEFYDFDVLDFGPIADQLKKIGPFLNLSEHIRKNFDRIRLPPPPPPPPAADCGTISSVSSGTTSAPPESCSWHLAQKEGSRLMIYNRQNNNRLVLENTTGIPKFRPMEETDGGSSISSGNRNGGHRDSCSKSCHSFLDDETILKMLLRDGDNFPGTKKDSWRCERSGLQRKLLVVGGVPLLVCGVRSCHQYWNGTKWVQLHASADRIAHS